MNPLAHKDPKIRLLNSGLFLGILHIGLFFLGNEKATPPRLFLSFAVMMALLAAFNFWRSRAALFGARRAKDFPGAAP